MTTLSPSSGSGMPAGGDQNETGSFFSTSTFVSGLGLARDLLSATVPSVEAGFEIAINGVETGFGIGRSALTVSSQGADELGLGPAGSTLRTIDSIVGFAHECTKMGMGISKELTLHSIKLTDSILEETGVKNGETMRLLTSYVQSQKGLEGYETKAAMLGVARLLGELEGIEVRNPLTLMSGARELANLKHHHKLERKAMNQEKLINNPPPKLMSKEINELVYFMKFAAATYGYQALIFLNVFKHTNVNAWEVASDEHAIEALVGVPKTDLLRLVTKSEIYIPGHYVAIDRISKKVVVAIRGTMRAQDVLVDLVCEQTEFESIYDGDEIRKGKAHKGFLTAAQRLAGELHILVAEALRENPGYELVITGHSLGAGVATILTLLWARMPEFRDRNICAFAFASPCSLCPELSQAPFTKRHITAVVIGDDVVARLSLSSFKDLQRALTTVAPLTEIPNEEKVQIYKSLPRESLDQKLFSSGRVWVLDSEEHHGHHLEVNPMEFLHHIELSSSMFSVHLPSHYLQHLSDLKEALVDENDPRSWMEISKSGLL
mmetsp:Transcript_18178/g.22423  ORF Transcript_18178/g.22423 Transcript_18178/m.22423 type:complete len:550 (+) Transcript_18178:108-1757(+)